MNPEDAAAERFKPIQKARAEIAKAEQAQLMPKRGPGSKRCEANSAQPRAAIASVSGKP